ncbi:hypothetical protein KM043_001178 [Ampulex compressa]|nr:hypothetical protein KM043_001178 [Ampulex compressa]
METVIPAGLERSRGLWTRSRAFLRDSFGTSGGIVLQDHLKNLRLFEVDAMSTKSYENGLESSRSFYKTTDKATLNYLKNHDPHLPHSINTLHLQNPYRSSQRLEGFTSREKNLKTMYRSRDSTLRSRYNKNLLAGRETVAAQVLDNHEEKGQSSTKEEIQTCFKTFSARANQYCVNSSLHGLRYVGDPKLSITERIFWMITFTVAVITASYYIWFLYQKWMSAPIIISLSPEPIALTEFPFPSVTICNMNNAKKSEATRIGEGSDLREKLLLDDVCDTENSTGPFDLDEGTIKWKNMLRFMINEGTGVLALNLKWKRKLINNLLQVSQPCTDMLYYCQWHGNQTDCEKIFNPTMTDEGICCNFNSVHRKHLFYNPYEVDDKNLSNIPRRDWSDLNITFPFNSSDWNPEDGYDLDVQPDTIPWRPYGAGQFYGLTLVLDADIKEYYCSSTASVGFKVGSRTVVKGYAGFRLRVIASFISSCSIKLVMLLHNPVETPKIADFAFAVTPGEETRVIVTPRISTASRTILSIPQRKRKCFFTSERKLRYYRTYTQRNCVLECEANFTQKICHCVQYYMPKSSNTPICGKKDDQCATNARRAMEVKLYDDDTGINVLNISETPSCNCWPGCFEINYNVEISQSKLLSSFKVADQYIKKSPKYFSENMAVVHLFFVDSQFTKFVKNELFGFTEFLSSTGGLLGLFMGFSFLSVMEILYFATLHLWCRLQEEKNPPRRTVLQVHPLDQTQKRIVYPFAQ